MICRHCLHENPRENHYCGNCGQPFEAQPPKIVAADTRSRTESIPDSQPSLRETGGWLGSPPPEEESALHGPSFLGLSADSPEDSLDLSYLTEEPAGHNAWRVVLALIIVAGFTAFLLWQWRQNPGWQQLAVDWYEPLPAPPQVATAAPPSPEIWQSKSGVTLDENAATEPAIEPSSDSVGDHPGASSNNALEAGQPGTPKQLPSGAVENDKAALADGASDTEARSESANKNPRELPGEQLFVKGKNYLSGSGGVSKNCDQALVYLRSAANLGHTGARSQLGALYATGHCVPLDRAAAYEWFTLAQSARGGNVWVQRNREMLWSQMTEAERQRATGRYRR